PSLPLTSQEYCCVIFRSEWLQSAKMRNRLLLSAILESIIESTPKSKRHSEAASEMLFDDAMPATLGSCPRAYPRSPLSAAGCREERSPRFWVRLHREGPA